MANLYLCPDNFWRCPIDLNHQVLAKRFQYHIRRCMIANPHIHRVRCVFNANHLMTPNELLSHMSTCPDAIDRSIVLIGLSDQPSTRPWSDNCQRSSTPTTWQMFKDVTTTEDWDDDIRERQARHTENKEPKTIFTSKPNLPASFTTEQSQDTVEQKSCRPDNTENVDKKVGMDSKTAIIMTKQAHVLKDYDNDGFTHPVETDDLSKNLMRIRAVQLLGGAGRGTCCLLRTTPHLSGQS